MPHMSHQLALKSHSSSKDPIRHGMFKVTGSGTGIDVIDWTGWIPGPYVVEHLREPIWGHGSMDHNIATFWFTWTQPSTATANQTS